MLGPGTSIFARNDTTTPRQPSLYRVDSTYVVEARAAAAASKMTMTAITAGVALAAIWFASRLK